MTEETSAPVEKASDTEARWVRREAEQQASYNAHSDTERIREHQKEQNRVERDRQRLERRLNEMRENPDDKYTIGERVINKLEDIARWSERRQAERQAIGDRLKRIGGVLPRIRTGAPRRIQERMYYGASIGRLAPRTQRPAVPSHIDNRIWGTTPKHDIREFIWGNIDADGRPVNGFIETPKSRKKGRNSMDVLNEHLYGTGRQSSPFGGSIDYNMGKMKKRFKNFFG